LEKKKIYFPNFADTMTPVRQKIYFYFEYNIIEGIEYASQK